MNPFRQGRERREITMREQIDAIVEIECARPADPEPARAPDVVLSTGEVPTVPTSYALANYSWNENTGRARFTYAHRRAQKTGKTKIVVEVNQPAGKHQIGWSNARVHKTDRDALLARYFEAQRVNNVMSAIGAYGR